MGIALRFLGRLFFVILFVGAGIQKIQTPEKPALYFGTQYKIFHQWVQTTQVFKQASEVVSPHIQQHIPLIKQYTSPEFLLDHSNLIITYIGYTQLFTSALIILGVPLAGFILYLFTISTIVFIHNPFANPTNFHQEFMNCVINLAIAGIALFIASDIRPKVNITEQAEVKKAQKEKVEASAPKKPSQAASVSKSAEKKRK
ncbi:DoxX family protein (macronuclear) [Tetrahymena thermophila SB210]|uniref:DoxX family protein n=1 Tax=Tetrahymena thermophila (strain SB210) TaxID=312017 RepID=Q229Q3_TETTS|nr:DoxX family protein [Tetrahymena thermophila SB210]EAR82019.1 DoxX family protein [Tetrahymena thermophila SB210]|eukprot:XP_001029682.1 DoxX family protein [Tetrahymena thermophila SB210]